MEDSKIWGSDIHGYETVKEARENLDNYFTFYTARGFINPWDIEHPRKFT